MSFDRLALGQEKKKAIRALVRSTESGRVATFDDFISGKGKGIICVLQYGCDCYLSLEFADELQRPTRRGENVDRGGSLRTSSTATLLCMAHVLPFRSPSLTSGRPALANWVTIQACLKTISAKSCTLQAIGRQCCYWTKLTFFSSNVPWGCIPPTPWLPSSCGSSRTSRVSCFLLRIV